MSDTLHSVVLKFGKIFIWLSITWLQYSFIFLLLIRIFSLKVDLVIVNKEGYEFARINLTNTNPDPNSTCGENYQTIKDLIISAR